MDSPSDFAEGEYGSYLCNAAQVRNVQRCLQELEQCILVLGLWPKLHGLEEASISDSEAESDSDDEHYEIKENDEGRCETDRIPAWQRGLLYSRK